MIKHVICFKLKDNSPAACEKAKEVLMSMKGNVPTVKDIAVGIDFLHICFIIILFIKNHSRNQRSNGNTKSNT